MLFSRTQAVRKVHEHLAETIILIQREKPDRNLQNAINGDKHKTLFCTTS
jgi:hypothetical protein